MPVKVGMQFYIDLNKRKLTILRAKLKNDEVRFTDSENLFKFICIETGWIHQYTMKRDELEMASHRWLSPCYLLT